MCLVARQGGRGFAQLGPTEPLCVSHPPGQSQPEFSTLIGRALKRLGSHWLDLGHSVAMPALLCHKDTAQGTQNPLGYFVPKPLVGGFGCLELCVYGIRELA